MACLIRHVKVIGGENVLRGLCKRSNDQNRTDFGLVEELQSLNNRLDQAHLGSFLLPTLASWHFQTNKFRAPPAISSFFSLVDFVRLFPPPSPF